MDSFVQHSIAWATCIVLVVGSVAGGITYTHTTWNEQKKTIITSCIENGGSWVHVPNTRYAEYECLR